MAILANIVAGSVAVFQLTGQALWQRDVRGLMPQDAAIWSEAKISTPSAWGTDLNLYGESNEAGYLLSLLYSFRDFRAVASFLRQNKELTPLLLEAYGQLRLHFGEKSSLALEAFVDPEAPSEYGLVAIIQVSLGPERALKIMDDFDMAWWLDALPRAHHKLTFALEYA
jgi:hypothetical protein